MILWIGLAASIFFIIIVLVLFVFLKKQILNDLKIQKEELLALNKQQFDLEQQKAVTELETRKQFIEINITGLKEQLNKYEQLIRQLEQDRAQKYGNLENELKTASQNTSKLQEATNRLNDILGNVKLRGQWGERMAEDIIRHAGLMEGINYIKQKKLADSATKPDYTFLLPDKHIVNMDVKFPLDNYLHMVNATASFEREKYEKEFIKNVKERIKEIQNRDYINPLENTLDFVLLFIPNEQVYGIIQEKIPDLMDESLKQKVVLCSPFTLYAVLSVIRQAHDNFRFQDNLKKIIDDIYLFSQYYEKFKSRFEDIGKAIEGLEKRYSDVHDTDFKKLDTKIRHIEHHKKGNQLTVGAKSDVIDVDEDVHEAL